MTAKYAIVTPYYREAPFVLRRCVDSVKNQTVSVEHFLISDGVPQVFPSHVRHIALDKPHSDYGGTPRSIGSILAMSEGFAGIGFLDADNWLEPNHVEQCLRRPDESVIHFPSEPTDAHVDTSRLFFLRGCFHMLPLWVTMPKEASTVGGDRFFYQALAKD